MRGLNNEEKESVIDWLISSEQKKYDLLNKRA